MRVQLENFLAQTQGIPSHNPARGLPPCTWAERSRLELGQRKVNSQSNEFTVNPDLLGMLVPPVAPDRGGNVRSRTGSTTKPITRP